MAPNPERIGAVIAGLVVAGVAGSAGPARVQDGGFVSQVVRDSA